LFGAAASLKHEESEPMHEDMQQGAAQALMQEMGIDEANVARRRQAVALDAADGARIASVRDAIISHIDELSSAFFDRLSTLDDDRSLWSSKALLEKARKLKRQHLEEMVSGQYGLAYVEQRLELAILYASARVDMRAFLGSFHELLKHIGDVVMAQYKGPPQEAFQVFMSLNKVGFFDVGLIADVLVFEGERVIRQQQEAIRELSTPVLQVRDRLLLLPIIGVIDTQRARLITESLLRAVRANRAKVVVMDVTGVATIDSRVANHILQTVTAARLMGAQVIVTGLSSEVAQSLAVLGIELSKLITVGDLQGGLEEAERFLGYQVSRGEPSPQSSLAPSSP
jgi:rsbT co-antagonist protein RsbR